jgi:hypothetical protein
MDALLSEVLKAHGGLKGWSRLTRITAQLSIDRPIWVAKGWPGALAQEMVEIDLARERSVFTPFTRPGYRSVFETDPERVTIETTSGQLVDQRLQARSAFRGHVRATPWDRLRLGYFIGYAIWNYLMTPFLFTWPGVDAHEIEPWREAGQTWRRLHVSFPPAIATHNPEQVFYFARDGLQRRMDYVTEILGATLVAHYTSQHQDFGGFIFPARRRVFHRNPEGTSNLNLPCITIDVKSVTVE